MSDPFVVGAIRRILKQKMDAAPGACPDANELSAWMESRLNPKEVARFEDHVSRCAGCQQALALSLQLSEAEPAAAETIAKPRVFSYRTSPIRLVFAAMLLVVVGVILFQSTRISVVDQKMSEVALNRAPAVNSGEPAAAMRSFGKSDAASLQANAATPAPGAPQPPIAEKAKTELAFRANRSSQASISSEVPKKPAAGELSDLALQKNKPVDAAAAPPSIANESKAVPVVAPPPAANLITLPLSTSNSISNSAMNVEIPPAQQTGGQTAQAQAGRGGGGGFGRGIGQGIGAQQAGVQQTQQSNVQQAAATQQADLAQKADVTKPVGAQPMRMKLDAMTAEAGLARETNKAVPNVRQALVEAQLLLAKDGKKTATKKIGRHAFYRTANFWVDVQSVAHAEAAIREMARDSQEFKDILAKEKKLSDIKDAPILLYWNAANCLIR